MLITSFFKAYKAFPSIRYHCTARLYCRSNKIAQLISAAILNHLKTQSPQLARFPFHGHGNDVFVGSTTTMFFVIFTAKVKFNGFHFTRKHFSILSDRTAQLLQPPPSSMINAQPEQVLQVNGIAAGLPVGKPKHGLESVGKWLFGAVHDGSGRQRLVVLAALANEKPPCALPEAIVPAFGSGKAVRPAQIKKINITSLSIEKRSSNSRWFFGKFFFTKKSLMLASFLFLSQSIEETCVNSATGEL